MRVRVVSINRLKAGFVGRQDWLATLLRVPLGGLLACALLTGCTVANKAVLESRPVSSPELQAEKSPVHTPPPVPQFLLPVTLLLSDDVPAYSRIADELVTRLPGNREIISLHGDPAAGDQAISKLNDSDRDYIVAIGSLAAQAASRLTGRQIVFCQVFNYQEHGLNAGHMRGVSILPPAELQFSTWKFLDAGLRQVGVISGPGHEALIAQARSAAKRHGIELVHRVANSDKEMLYTFKRLSPEIQGLWLLPDDRILSRRVLRDVMAYSNKHHKQVMVFHPELLRLGGLLSVSGMDADIADQVIAALHASSARTAPPAAGLLPLTRIRIEVNAQSLQELHTPAAPGRRAVADVP
ncbi:MAG TPA: ABC transporter substrate binding protein [Gammaproteobacteria bacterium]|nr:ABC transporter substrate binding protein [Gammaproteobacteria bacterium]